MEAGDLAGLELILECEGLLVLFLVSRSLREYRWDWPPKSPSSHHFQLVSYSWKNGSSIHPIVLLTNWATAIEWIDRLPVSWKARRRRGHGSHPKPRLPPHALAFPRSRGRVGVESFGIP